MTLIRPYRQNMPGGMSTADMVHQPFAVLGSYGSGTWPSANLAIYIPVIVYQRVVITKLSVSNGSTASGNFDVGVYTAAGTLAVSKGSTAQTGTSTEQFVDVTDTQIGPGLYYLAAAMDGTTGTTTRIAPAAPICAAMGILTEALGSVTLPTTATWAVNQTLTYVPMLGMVANTVVA